MSWIGRFANLFRQDRLDDDIEDELRFHLEERARELEDKGMSPSAAAVEARRRLGNRLLLRETSREIKLLPWLDSIAKDVRFGVRMLRKDAVVTLATLVSLAMAIGACTAAFSLVDALILRPLPVKEPEQLISLSYPTFSAERPHSDPSTIHSSNVSAKRAANMSISSGQCRWREAPCLLRFQRRRGANTHSVRFGQYV